MKFIILLQVLILNAVTAKLCTKVSIHIMEEKVKDENENWVLKVLLKKY